MGPSLPGAHCLVQYLPQDRRPGFVQQALIPQVLLFPGTTQGAWPPLHLGPRGCQSSGWELHPHLDPLSPVQSPVFSFLHLHLHDLAFPSLSPSWHELPPSQHPPVATCHFPTGLSVSLVHSTSCFCRCGDPWWLCVRNQAGRRLAGLPQGLNSPIPESDHQFTDI